MKWEIPAQDVPWALRERAHELTYPEFKLLTVYFFSRNGDGLAWLSVKKNAEWTGMNFDLIRRVRRGLIARGWLIRMSSVRPQENGRFYRPEIPSRDSR